MEEATHRKILNGWKQISNHLDRGVRTAQRWEVLLGMPVHRPALKDRSAVVAFSDELESWLSRTPTEARNECVATDNRVTDGNNDRSEILLRALDNLSTVVRQSCDLLSQMQALQAQLRRSRSRRIASKPVPSPRRKQRSRVERTVLTGMVHRTGVR
jgi:hypothetical protein